MFFSRIKPYRDDLTVCCECTCTHEESTGRPYSMMSAAKGEGWEEYADRHGNHGKSVVMLLARNYTGLTLGDIGEALGGKDYGAVCMAIRRFEKKPETDRNARRLLAKAENMLDVKM